jgi:hypothetical protein
MKKLYTGFAGVVVAILTAMMLIVTSVPASAYEGPKYDPLNPPRIAPPANTPTTPNVIRPVTTPLLPPSLLLRLLPSIGIGLGGVTGDMCNTASFRTAHASDCSYWKDPAAPSTPMQVRPLPDAAWCKVLADCGSTTDPTQTEFMLEPSVPPTQWGKYNYSVVGFTAPSSPQVTRTWQAGSFCGEYPSSCTGFPTSNMSTVEVRGQCKNLLTGQKFGLATSASNVNGSTWLTSTFSSGSGTSFAAIEMNNVTRSNAPMCANNTTLEWFTWRDEANNTTASGNEGVWVNPDVDMYKDTTLTSTIVCKLMSNPAVSTTVTKTGPPGTGMVPVVTCPEGYTADSGKTEVGTGTTGLLTAPKKIEEWSILPETREAYPLCLGWTASGCTLQILLDGTPCTPSVVECRNWEEVWRVQPSRVKCFYGPYEMDMSQCAVLRNMYVGETGIVTNPRVSPDAAPVPVDPNGNPLPPNPDPAVPVPAPGTDPGTGPGTDPGTGTDPDPNAPWNNPAPIPDYGANPVPNPGGNPIPTPDTGSPNLDPNTNDTNCWPGGTAAFNPLEWVLQPVKCALSWAFVPRQAVAQTQMTKVQNAFNKVPVVASVGTVTTAIGTLGGGAGGGTGCEGPQFQFDFQTVHETMHPFSACAEPVATMARITNALTTVVVIVLGVLGVVRAFGASVGFNFSMGKGADS